MKRNPLILIYNEKKLFFLQVWIHQLITSSMARPLETVKDINESKDSWKIATTKVKDTGSAVKNVLSVIESLKKQVAMKHIVSLKVIRTYALNKTWWISFLMDIIRDIVDVKGNISAYKDRLRDEVSNMCLQPVKVNLQAI
ncbi:unnamed protein product [Vicia faba]|uniref:Uncharacterized protein n=1 Tax=Vicia faba TaxID=3906 RepID=A0AAV1AUJ4_VICFA|nr:unnamed protein product [Vicia faba]